MTWLEIDTGDGILPGERIGLAVSNSEHPFLVSRDVVLMG